MKPLIVSFHTGEDRYAKDAERMVASAEKFGYQTYIEIIQSGLNWTRACCLKPSFILKTMEKFGRRPFLWIDCDGEIIQPLTGLENPHFNFGIPWDPRLRFTSFSSGTTYFDLRDSRALNLLMEWGVECDKVIKGKIKEEWDQRVLFRVWKSRDKIPITKILGQGYVKIFDRGWREGATRVEYVRHHQASREIRKIK
jgi:hypothetical protein